MLQEKTCEESTSFDLTPYEVASAISAVDRLLVEQMKAAGAGETLPEDCSLDCDSGQDLLLDGGCVAGMVLWGSVNSFLLFQV